MAGNRQVAHIWAQQTKDHGKGSNFYFRGPTIYSYGPHFPIATFTDKHARGQRVVLFTTGRYGNSTAKHLNYTGGALCGLPVHVLYVPHVLGNRHADNMRDFESRYREALANASRARLHGEWHLSTASRVHEEAKLYAEAFGCALPDFPEMDAAALAAIRARAAKEYAARAEAEERRAALWAAENAERIERWRNGEDVRMVSHHGPTMLRLTADGARIETSRGALVPRAVAPKLWKLARMSRADGRAIGGLSERVGEFHLSSITRTGDLIIGYHTIEFAELERMAAILGLPPSPITEERAAA